MSRTALVLLLVAAAVFVSACGGSDSAPTLAEYEQSVVTARDRVDFALARITKAKAKEEFLNRMDEASAAIDNAAGRWGRHCFLAQAGTPPARIPAAQKFLRAAASRPRRSPFTSGS